MKSSAPCQTETLVMGSSCDIQYCFDCKMVHLNIGSLTLRVSRNQFHELMTDLNKGEVNLRQRELNRDKTSKANLRILHS